MPQPPVTRATLLVRLRNADDDEAWRQFLDLYGPVVYSMYRKRGLQDADAADLTQEVLHAVASGAQRSAYDPERGTFRGWLYAVARNKLRDFLARRKRQPQGNGDTSTLKMMSSIPATDAETAEWESDYQQRLFALAAEKVRTCVDESTWQAFWRTAVEGQSGQAVADALGMTVGAVYVAKSRVLARLKEQVKQIQGDQS